MRRQLYGLLTASLLALALLPASLHAQGSIATVPIALDAANECAAIGTDGMGTVSFDVTGTWVGTLTFYVVGENGTVNQLDVAKPDTPGTAVNTTTANGVWSGPVAGFAQARVCATSYTSGTAIVSLRAAATGGGSGGSSGGGGAGTSDTTEATQLLVLAAVDQLEGYLDTLETLLAGIDSGTLVTATNLDVQIGGSDSLTIGTFPDNEPINVAQMNGVAVSMGSGVTGTGVQRIDIATDALITTSIVAMAGDIDTMVTGLAVDTVHDQAVTDSGPPDMRTAADFDGAAISTAVSAEGDGVRGLASLYGIPYAMLVNEDGSKTPFVDEDVASAAADLLVKIGAIRDDTLDARSGTEGDYEMLHLNANGALWAIDVNSAAALTSTQLLDDIVGVEDAAETAGGGLAMAGTVRRDTAATSAGTAGDNATLNTDGLGRVWARPGGPCEDHARISDIKIDTATSGNVELVALNGSDVFYVCGYNFISTAAQSVQMISGTGTACATGETDETGPYAVAANGGISVPNTGAVQFTTAAGAALCIELSAASQVSGIVSYVRTATP